MNYNTGQAYYIPGYPNPVYALQPATPPAFQAIRIPGRPDTQQAAQQPPQQPVQQGQAVRAPIRVGFPGQAPPNLTAPLVQAVNINANAQPAQPAQPAANPQSQPVQAVNVAPAPAPAPAPAANNGPPRTRLVYLTNNPGNPVPPGQAAFNERQRLAAQSQYEIFERQYPNFGRNDPWAYATDNFKTKYSIGPCGKCLKTEVDNECPTLDGLHVCQPCYNANR